MLSILKGDTSCRITKDLTEIYFIENFTFKNAENREKQFLALRFSQSARAI